jgi:hypothetical protein
VLELRTYDGNDEVVLRFEHSLLSLSKWEEIHQKPFLHRTERTGEEMIDYFGCMLTSPEHDPTMVFGLSPDQFEQLTSYVNSERTASTVDPDPKAKKGGQIVTSELIYSWLVGLEIPFQPTESWHLSRTMMLIQMVTRQKSPPEKQDKATALSKWDEMNRRNKERFQSNG